MGLILLPRASFRNLLATTMRHGQSVPAPAMWMLNWYCVGMFLMCGLQIAHPLCNFRQAYKNHRKSCKHIKQVQDSRFKCPLDTLRVWDAFFGISYILTHLLKASFRGFSASGLAFAARLGARSPGFLCSCLAALKVTREARLARRNRPLLSFPSAKPIEGVHSDTFSHCSSLVWIET